MTFERVMSRLYEGGRMLVSNAIFILSFHGTVIVILHGTLHILRIYDFGNPQMVHHSMPCFSISGPPSLILTHGLMCFTSLVFGQHSHSLTELF